MQRVVILCGGRGANSIQEAFLERSDCELTAVVNPYDDGKSTGEIRRLFDMPGPSDIRKNLKSMLAADHPDSSAYRRLFAFRYPRQIDASTAIDDLVAFVAGEADLLPGLSIEDDGIRFVLRRLVEAFVGALARHQYRKNANLDFGDCSLMNCIIAGAYELLDRDLGRATSMLGRLFKIRGQVLPTSRDNLKLVALRRNGDLLLSEEEIVSERSEVPISRIFLVPEYPDRQVFESLSPRARRSVLETMSETPQATPEVLQAIARADIIVYGPGTQHSSLFPTYRTQGIAEAIAANLGAEKVFVTNIAPDVDILGFTAADIVISALGHLNAGSEEAFHASDLIDHILVNLPPVRAGEAWVSPDLETLRVLGPEIVAGRFESRPASGRHDGRRVVEQCLEALRGSLVESLQA